MGSSGLKNLKVDKALVDTGSQISLVSHAYLVRHKLDLRSIVPLSVPCSLKSATGRMMNPFKGKINLSLRFCTMQNKLTRNVITSSPTELNVQAHGTLLLHFW